MGTLGHEYYLRLDGVSRACRWLLQPARFGLACWLFSAQYGAQCGEGMQHEASGGVCCLRTSLGCSGLLFELV